MRRPRTLLYLSSPRATDAVPNSQASRYLVPFSNTRKNRIQALRIFEGLIRTLPLVWNHGVGSVANQDSPALYISRERFYVAYLE